MTLRLKNIVRFCFRKKKKATLKIPDLEETEKQNNNNNIKAKQQQQQQQQQQQRKSKTTTTTTTEKQKSRKKEKKPAIEWFTHLPKIWMNIFLTGIFCLGPVWQKKFCNASKLVYFTHFALLKVNWFVFMSKASSWNWIESRPEPVGLSSMLGPHSISPKPDKAQAWLAPKPAGFFGKSTMNIMSRTGSTRI